MLSINKESNRRTLSDFFNNIDAGIDDFSAQKTELILDAISNLPASVAEKSLTDTTHNEGEINQDKRFAIEHIKNSARIAEHASREVFKLAISSDQPRAWEVLSALLKTNIDAAKTLMDSHVPVAKTPENINPTVGTQNNYFIGSAEDMFDMIDELDKSRMKVIEHEGD